MQTLGTILWFLVVLWVALGGLGRVFPSPRAPEDDIKKT
jgi:hypothetical protein